MTEIDDLSALRIEREPLNTGGGRWVKWVVLLVILAAAGGGAWYWFNRERPVEVRLDPLRTSEDWYRPNDLAPRLFDSRGKTFESPETQPTAPSSTLSSTTSSRPQKSVKRPPTRFWRSTKRRDHVRSFA